MWILESEGDTFKGKKFWLRPGKKFLIGRTKVEGAKYAIEDKTVSKKHLTVEVGPIELGDCQNVHRRSRVSVKDSSKIGTLLNDEQIRNSQRELQHEYNEIRLGRHKHLFKINWIPVTLTFSFAGKLAKTEFPKLYETLGPLDIKVLNTYEQGQTTHVVAKSRNTSKGLQALIDGKFIVSQTFTDAIIKAAQPSSTLPAPIQEAEDEGPAAPLESESALEEDFEGNFPNALDHLPPCGQEPTKRPSEAYAPNSARKNMFEGYTYIFYEKGQFNTLLAPITQGGGKATLERVVAHQTTVDDFVRRVKGVAGEKGLGEFEDGSVGKGVVVVRFIPKETEDPAKEEARIWYGTFYNRVALQLDHRLIEQNEFLDAILNNDASVLRKSLEVEETGTMAPPPSVATAMTSQTMRSSPPPHPTPGRPVEASAEVEAALVRRGRPRRAVTSRFKGFEDDDFESLPNNSAPPLVEVSQAHSPVESQSQSMFVSQDPQEMVVDSPPRETQTTKSRKRKTPPVVVEESEEEDIMEQMAPVAAARKRRRENDEAARRERGESIPPPPAPAKVQKSAAPVQKPKKQKPVEEIDVQGELARRREKERKIAEAETLALREQLDGMDIEQIRNLAIIEEVEVKRLESRPRMHGEDSERWDDKWNGRKNFKKFRPKGQNGPRNLNRVIVQLEEVKKRDYGIGDEYWLAGDACERPKKGKRKGKGKETLGVSQVQSQSSRPSSARSQAVDEEVIEDPIANDASSSEDLPDDVPKFPKAKPSTAASRSSRQTSVASVANAPQERPSQSKRPAATTLTKPAPAKKARQITLRKPESDKDSDSEDELKFRFRKKK